MRLTIPSRLLLLFLTCCTIVFLVQPAKAKDRGTGEPITTCIVRDRPGLTSTQLLRPSTPVSCLTDQRTLGPGNYWIRSTPLHRGGPVNVRSASLWRGTLNLYALYADGALVRTTIDQRHASRYMQLGALLEVPLPERNAPLVRLLWQVEDAANLRGIVRDPMLATDAESVRSNLLLGGLYAAFAGLCIALLSYNFALWVALRHRFQLAYCAMVLGLLAYTVSSSGYLAWIYPDIGNNDRIRCNYLLLGLSTVAAFAFARAFFEERVFAGRVGTLVQISCGITFTASLAFFLFGPLQVRLFDRLYSLAFVLQMAMVIPLLWRAWVLRSNYLWVFALAWAMPIMMATVRIVCSLGIIPWNFWLDNSTIVSMTVEALLSSIAIAYRMRLLSNERDEAREREIAARLLADTDPLTGLLNRRAFLNQAIGRKGEQILMIADLDHFKQVNETVGHDGGDEVLRVFARTLCQVVPADALVARIGGEEFAVVLAAGGAFDPEDILAGLRAERMPFDVTITASIGVCVGTLEREQDWKALYGCADRALFEAKSAGRDRARVRILTNQRTVQIVPPLAVIR